MRRSAPASPGSSRQRRRGALRQRVPPMTRSAGTRNSSAVCSVRFSSSSPPIRCGLRGSASSMDSPKMSRCCGPGSGTSPMRFGGSSLTRASARRADALPAQRARRAPRIGRSVDQRRHGRGRGTRCVAGVPAHSAYVCQPTVPSGRERRRGHLRRESPARDRGPPHGRRCSPVGRASSPPPSSPFLARRPFTSHARATPAGAGARLRAWCRRRVRGRPRCRRRGARRPCPPGRPSTR